VQARRVGGGKAVGDPPTDPTPKDGHLVQDGWRGLQTADPYKSIGAKRERSRERQRCEEGDSLLLAVLQWISLVFGMEKEILIREAFLLGDENDF